MFKRLSIHIALVFLFAFAQIGAVTHENSHVKDLVSHSQQDSSKQDKNTNSEQCAQCISFAKITGGLLAQTFVFTALQASFVASTPLSNQLSSQHRTAYAARAPPTLS
jgi:hypothetical protein